MKNLFTFFAVAILSFNTSVINAAPAHEEKMIALILVMDNGNDDQQVIETIYTSMMTAEKIAGILEVELIAEDEVNDDVFVFSLKSEDQKVLAMKMFDEEGYELAASRMLNVQVGNNYNALNVKSMEDGTYKFQLTDENGKEKITTVTINRNK